MSRQLIILFSCGLLVLSAPLENTCGSDEDCEKHEDFETMNKLIPNGTEPAGHPSGESVSGIVLYAGIAALVVSVAVLYAAYAAKRYRLASEQEHGSVMPDLEPGPSTSADRSPFEEGIQREPISTMPSEAINNDAVEYEIAQPDTDVPVADKTDVE